MSPSIYRRLGRVLGPYWPVLGIATLAAFVYVALNGISIWLIASLVNSILSDFQDLVQQQARWSTSPALTVNERLKFWTNLFILRDTPVDSLKVLCITILVVFVMKNVFLYIKNILLALVQLRLVTVIRNRLYDHLHSLSLGYFNNKRSGEISSIVVNDVAVMQNALSTSFQKLLVEPINILTFTTLLFIISWKLAVVAVVIIPLAGVVTITIGRSIRRKSHRTQAKIARIMDMLGQTLSSIRIVKAFVMEDLEVRRFFKESETYFKLLFRRARLNQLAAPVTESFGVIIGIILLWIGGLEVITQRGISAEDFIRFILILFSVLGPIRQLSNVHIRIQMGIASAERVFQVLDTPSDIVDRAGAVEKTSFERALEFQQVYFHYQDGDERVLEDVSFRVEKGQSVALVGPSGAGKTTIADLMPRFYDVTSGAITIDGEDIRHLTLRSLRHLMGIVTQEIILFNDTVANNISYGMESVSPERIREAARAANALEFILRLPGEFDCMIGERGLKLSGGQKQRLAIARALVKNPPILILDEATSALDTESEKMVQEAIERLMLDRTTLVIAHRLSTVLNASQIFVMDSGRVAEAGTHQELYQLDGLYRRLYDIQFSGPD